MAPHTDGFPCSPSAKLIAFAAAWLGGSSAPAIAVEIGESRSNAYKVLDKLCELGLASKDQAGKKSTTTPPTQAPWSSLCSSRLLR